MTAAQPREVLLVTEDGYAKRMPIRDIPKTRRGAAGRRVSTVPLAAAITIANANTDVMVVLVSANGKVQVVPLAEVPARRRARSNAHQSKGARVMTLAPGDRVASVVLASPERPLKRRLTASDGNAGG